jgi:hypothetical protein
VRATIASSSTDAENQHPQAIAATSGGMPYFWFRWIIVEKQMNIEHRYSTDLSS